MVWLVATAWAGAWVQDPGHGYGKVGGSVFQGAEASYAGVGIYAEVGLPAGFQALVSVPLGVGTQPRGGVVYRRWAAGDARVGVARRLLPTVSASFLAKIPLYGDPDLAAYGALAERFPRPGDGQVDLDLRVDGGRSLRLGGVDGWAQGGVGWLE